MSCTIRLDARLSLACDLYDPCELAADIGTDHAHLPAALLQRGRCQHMILTDLSKSALQNARNEMIRFRLLDRVSLRAGDGLAPLEEPCGMISVTGMGGRTVRDILISGKEKLRGASLVLSAHTDLPLIREAVNRIGYHLDREEPCFCAGRYYLVMRARPGALSVTPQEIRLGGPLFESGSDQLIPWIKRRREVLESSLRGLLSAETPDEELIARVREDIGAYDDFIRKGIKPNER
ncbi:MAG: SAM-dependent methyltransferase [Clostridia bacterium]|nr:SAM-dependent methyltransferase [Clostridia bacterium]